MDIAPFLWNFTYKLFGKLSVAPEEVGKYKNI